MRYRVLELYLKIINKIRDTIPPIYLIALFVLVVLSIAIR